DEVGVFRRPVVLGGRDEVARRRRQLGGARAGAHLDAGGAQRGDQTGQQTRRHVFVNQQRLSRVAGRGVLRLRVQHDGDGFAQVGGAVNVDVADALAVTEDGDAAVACDVADGLLRAARDG